MLTQNTNCYEATSAASDNRPQNYLGSQVGCTNSRIERINVLQRNE